METFMRLWLCLVIIVGLLYAVHCVKSHARDACEARGGTLLMDTRDLVCISKDSKVIHY